MSFFPRIDGQLYAEGLPLSALAAQYGTPLYIYSRAALEAHWQAFEHALEGLGHLICYSVKANSNLAVLGVLARLGSGFDIVSGGELTRVLRAGGDPAKVVFSGVGKSEAEMHQALAAGILCFNVESLPELERLNAVAARLGLRAPVSLRVNPDVDARTHPYISTGLRENKFGIDISQAPEVFATAQALPHIQLMGVDCHIGSQLTELGPFLAALERVLDLIESLARTGIRVHHLNMGGGLGVRYQNEHPPAPQEYIAALRAALATRDTPGLTVLIEPGRAIVANAGILLTRVEYLKHTPAKAFAVVDAGMNDLIRPALYSAWQDIVPVMARAGAGTRYDVVGPVCETGDFLGKDRVLELATGDLLAVCSAGAYGFVMSSNYNTRPRPAEVMVDGTQAHVVRARESLEHVLAGERVLPCKPGGV